jgi:hypothetical protein
MTSNFFSPLSFVAVFGSEIRDPGWVKIRIRDKHPGSATLFLTATPEARYLNYGSGSSSYLNIFRLLDFYYQILIKLEEFL